MKHFLALTLMLFLMAISMVSQGQSVTSDLPDYAPGSTATITGAGFTAGEDILIHVDHFFDFYGHEDETYTATADENGSFEFLYQVGWDEDQEFFILTATGQASEKVASCKFTDAALKFTFDLDIVGAPGASATVITSGTSFNGNPLNYSTTVTGVGNNGQDQVQPGSTYYFTFPTNITGNTAPYIGVNYKLVSVDKSSPQVAGANGGQMIITAIYELACTTPTIEATNITGITNIPGQCSASVAFGENITIGGTPTPTVTYTANGSTITSPHTFPVGTTTVTATTSNNGCGTASTTFTVTVTDNEAPALAATPEVTGNNDAGLCSKVVVLTAPTATDNCGIAAAGVTASGIPADNVFPVGTTTVTWSVTDIHGNTTTQTQDVVISDTEAPALTATTQVTGNNDAGLCSKVLVLTAPTATDNCGITAAGVTSTGIPAGNVFPVGTTTVTWSVTDIHGNTSTATQSVTVTNDAPVINSVSTEVTPFAVNTPVALEVSYTDNNVISALINWGDGSSESTISNPNPSFSSSHTYTAAGVYTVNVTVTDACDEEANQLYQYVVVYDPSAGFVTGGGWIESPPGASRGYPDAIGKANFGFVSKYEKGKSVPTGNTEFQFKAGDLNFKSTSYEWLVISGTKAQFKGIGTINGTGNYGFILSAIDGSVDKFRIKIWDIGTGMAAYDNLIGSTDDNADPTTILGGGSIVIHSGVIKNKLAQITPDPTASTFEPSLKVYPNPFTERLNIEFSYKVDTKAKLEIFSVTGARLQTLYDGPVNGGQLYNFEYLPRLTGSQMVFYHLTLDGKTKVGKILFNERR